MALCALVVEDLNFWQETLREVLVDAGYAVTIASDLASAMNAVTNQEFQVVIIDPVLNDTNRHNRDGLRFLKHVLEKYPTIRAIVTTSSDPNHIRHDVAELSAAVPILWKDEWDDDRFLAILRDFFASREG